MKDGEASQEKIEKKLKLVKPESYLNPKIEFNYNKIN